MSNRIRGTTTDNSGRSLKNIFGNVADLDDLKLKLLKISGKEISDLKNKENLLIYCNEDKLKDDVESRTIFNLSGDKLITGNIAGFIGIDDVFLTINSRFIDNNNDNFLYYLLCKVFNINVSELEHSTSNKESLDVFLYLYFKCCLDEALSQGLYKKYEWHSYNDSKVKGCIDIAEHIKRNCISNGNIAYKLREQTYDNNLNQLIRHTIEFIKKETKYSFILDSNEETRKLVQSITNITPTYSKDKRRYIINKNLKSQIHPYYYKYEDLRKICIWILTGDNELRYGKDSENIYGLLFDMSFLWEEYLYTVLREYEYLEHPENRKGKGAIHLLSNNTWEAYPDFYARNKIVLDAKYKRYKDEGKLKDVDTNDRYQLLSYMYVLNARNGVFIVPSENAGADEERQTVYDKNQNKNAEVILHKFHIPQKAADFKEFSKEIQKSENNLKAKDYLKAK